RIILVEDKVTLMRKLGKKRLSIALQTPLETVPPALSSLGLTLISDGTELTYSYDAGSERTGIAPLIAALNAEGISIRDLSTDQSSLEDIFIQLVKESA